VFISFYNFLMITFVYFNFTLCLDKTKASGRRLKKGKVMEEIAER